MPTGSRWPVPTARATDPFRIEKALGAAPPSPQPWANEKFVLREKRVHPGLVAPFFSPPCEGGVRGGDRGTACHNAVTRIWFFHSQAFGPAVLVPAHAAKLVGRAGSTLPNPPFARGGKSFASSFACAIKNIRLAALPAGRLTPTFHHPTRTLPRESESVTAHRPPVCCEGAQGLDDGPTFDYCKTKSDVSRRLISSTKAAIRKSHRSPGRRDSSGPGSACQERPGPSGGDRS